MVFISRVLLIINHVNLINSSMNVALEIQHVIASLYCHLKFWFVFIKIKVDRAVSLENRLIGDDIKNYADLVLLALRLFDWAKISQKY